MKILFLSRWFPYPPDNGARIRIYHLLKGLAQAHAVDLVTFAEDEVSSARIDALKLFLRGVRVVPYRPYQPSRAQALLGLLSTKPRSSVDTYNQEFANQIHSACQDTQHDLVIASEIDMALYARHVPGAKKILEELEITKIEHQYRSETQWLKRARYRLTWMKLARFVADLMREYDGCTVVSDLEMHAVRACAPAHGRLAIIPNGVDTRFFTPADAALVDPRALVYTGAVSYPVNFEAVEYFVKEIFPAVLDKRPDAVLYVTGGTGAAPIERLKQDGRVMFTGYVDDMRTVLAKACVNVVPILTGGGTRLKILEGLAAGTPIVSTSRGAEGLALVPGRDFVLADAPEAFARGVVQLMDDPRLRKQFAANGRKLVEDRYDWASINEQFDAFIRQVVTNERPT